VYVVGRHQTQVSDTSLGIDRIHNALSVIKTAHIYHPLVPKIWRELRGSKAIATVFGQSWPTNSCRHCVDDVGQRCKSFHGCIPRPHCFKFHLMQSKSPELSRSLPRRTTHMHDQLELRSGQWKKFFSPSPSPCDSAMLQSIGFRGASDTFRTADWCVVERNRGSWLERCREVAGPSLMPSFFSWLRLTRRGGF